jgi:hypothetical protein
MDHLEHFSTVSFTIARFIWHISFRNSPHYTPYLSQNYILLTVEKSTHRKPNFIGVKRRFDLGRLFECRRSRAIHYYFPFSSNRNRYSRGDRLFCSVSGSNIDCYHGNASATKACSRKSPASCHALYPLPLALLLAHPALRIAPTRDCQPTSFNISRICPVDFL